MAQSGETPPKFSDRAFHDFILGSGPLPLEILEERFAPWLAEAART